MTDQKKSLAPAVDLGENQDGLKKPEEKPPLSWSKSAETAVMADVAMEIARSRDEDPTWQENSVQAICDLFGLLSNVITYKFKEGFGVIAELETKKLVQVTARCIRVLVKAKIQGSDSLVD